MLKKNLLLAILIVFSFVVLGGAVFYNNSLKKQTTNGSPAPDPIGDPQPQSTDYEEVAPPQQPVETEKIEEADGSAPTAPNAPRTGGSAETANARQDPPSGGTGVPLSTQSGGTESLSTQSGGTDPLRTQIEQKYIARLQSLASGYEGRLNGLVASALSEYESVKKANPDANITPLIEKYYSAGKALEAECDSQFYSILAAFESELSANSFPLDMAVQSRETYEARKGARAGQITSGKP